MKNLLKYLFICFIAATIGQAKQINDMADRVLNIPDNPQRVYTASGPMLPLVYALAPHKLIGVNFSFYLVETVFMLQSVKDLPVLGGLGGNRHASAESILAQKPDIILAWELQQERISRFEKSFSTFNVPIVYISQNSMEEMLQAIKLGGEILGANDRAKKLIDYGQTAINKVKKSVHALGDRQKVKVYLAQGRDGLRTECANRLRSQIIDLAGGINVHQCDPNRQSSRRDNITMEKLLSYDPDVIFVRQLNFFNTYKNNKLWKDLRAVKEGRVYLVPSSPFSWTGRPPSLMRLLGMQWMHKRLYPDHFDIDLNAEIKFFYENFLHVKLSDEDIQTLYKGM